MSLTLKIQIVRDKQVKAMKFSPTQTVAEVCAQVREKINETSGDDHGLFQPGIDAKRPSRWLKMDKTLQFYDLKINDELDYKKKHRPLKVRLMDETVKTMLIDDSLTAGEILEIIGKRIGIKNYEEFSLQTEGAAAGEWINHSQPLHEQGVSDDAIVLLKKKFFVDDFNVNRDDPIQLHLVYVQSRDAIISGSHPCSYDEAIQFAALQCQIQLGNHNPNLHKPGYLKIKEYLPPSFHKKKDAEKDIYKEFRKLTGMSESNSKFRYVQLCRSLKTYGITFFLTKERVKGQKKPVNKLLGITRDSILRLDAETKEVEHEYPLNHLRRWAASPQSFTLDFGDYEDDYVSVITSEGEAISQLLSGYIEILMKKRKDTGTVIDENETDIANVESVGRIRGQTSQATTSSSLSGFDGNGGREGQYSSPGQAIGYRGGLGGPLSVKVTNIDSASAAVANLLNEMELDPNMVIGQKSSLTPQQWRQQLAIHAKAVAAAAGKLLGNLNNPNGMDKNQMDSNARDVALTIDQLVHAARAASIASGEDPDGEMPLFDGAKAVAESISKLLKATKDLSSNPNDENARNLIAQAADQLKLMTSYLDGACNGVITDPGTLRLLMEAGKAIAIATQDLVNQSNVAIEGINDPIRKNQMVMAIEETMKAGIHASAVSQALAATILDPNCRQQFNTAAKTAQDTNTYLLSAAKAAQIDGALLEKLRLAAKNIADAYGNLIQSADLAQPKSGDDVEFTAASKTILSSAAQLLGSQGKPDAIIQQSKIIEEAMGHLIAGARRAALKTDDPGVRDRLIQCSKAVAEAVRFLMEVAQESADNPEDKVLFAKLQESSKRVATAVKQLVGDAGKESAFQLLRTNAKLACAATTGLMNTSRQAMLQGHLSDQESNKLLLACVTVGPVLNNLLNAITSSQKAPNDLSEQNHLIEVARTSAPIAYQVVASAKGAIPHFTDQHSKQEVSNSSNNASDAIKALLDSIGELTSAVGQQEFDDALDTVQALEADMESSALMVQAGQINQIPGQTRENALELLNVAARALGSSAKQVLLQYKTQPEKLGETSKDLATSVSQVTNAAKSVCFTTANRSVQKAVLGAAKQITTESTNLVSCARAVSANPGDPSLESALQSSVKAIAEALANLLTTSKGGDPGGKELDDAIEAIKNDTKRINNPPVNLGGEGGVNSEKAISSSKALVGAVSQVAANARSNPSALGASARTTSTTFTLLVDTVNLCTGTIANKTLAIEIVKGAQLLGIESIKLLQASRFAASRPGEGENELNQSQQSVSNIVKQLIYNIQSSVPGQAEIADAIEMVKQAILALNSTESTGSRPHALENLTQAAKSLADYSAQVVQSKGNSEKMGGQCKSAAESLKDVVDYTKASLSTAEGHPDSIVTLASKVEDSSNALFNSCKKTGALSDQDKKNAAIDAKNLALSVPNLMNAAKKISASLVQSNPEKSKDILLIAQNITMATSKLVNIAKSVASGQQADLSQLNSTKKEVSELISKLLSSTNGHDQDAASVSIDLDSLSKSEQALLDASRSTANYMSQFMAISKNVSTGTKDANVHQQFSGAAQNVSTGVQQLLAAINGMKPEQKDLDESIEIIQNAVVDLDSATLNAAIGLLENTAPAGKTAQVCQEELVDISRELATSMKTFLAAPKQDPSNLGQSAKDTANILPKIVNISKQLASLTTNPDIKQTQLLLSKKLADNMLELMISAKSGDVSDSKQAFNASQSIADILTSVKGGVMQSRDCDESIQIIGKSKENLQKPANDTHGKTYQQYRDEMTEIAKQLALGVSQLANSAKSKPEEIGSSSLKIASIIPRLAETARSTAAATNDVAAKKKLIDSTAGIIDATSNIISDAKLASADHKNTQLQQKISNNFKDITTQIANLISALRAGATGDRDIETAINEVNHVTTDLDAASLFAAAGQIDVETDGHTAKDIQEQVGKLSQDLKNANNQLVDSTNKTIEDVGFSSKAIASVNQKLAHATKVCAALSNDPTTQQNLLSAARAVSSNLQTTISASKNTQKNPSDANKSTLDKSSKQLEESIDSLANLVQSSTTTKGISELDGVSSEIRKQLSKYDTPNANTNANATAEDVVNSAKNLAESIAYLVSSCNNNPEEIAEACKATTQSVKSLLANAKGSTNLTDDAVIQSNVTESAKDAANSLLKLVQAAKQQRNDPTNPACQNKLSEVSSEVIESISSCVNNAELLPGGEKAKRLFAAGENLEEVAEKELRAAAQVIEDATAALLKAKKNREQSRLASGIDEAGIDEAIIDAARAITSATGILVQCATAVQHELVLAGKVGNNKGGVYRRDPTWARGLISAAQTVAGSVQGLVGSANSSTQGKVDEEQLVASARSVAAATARLVTASRAKADLNSASNSQLAQAAKQVSNATAALVEAAKQSQEEPEPEFDASNLTNAQLISTEMNQQIQILKLKKELEQAEKKLFSIRKKEYSDQTGNPSPAKNNEPTTSTTTTSISVGTTPTKRAPPPSPPMTPTSSTAPALPPRPLMKKPAPSTSNTTTTTTSPAPASPASAPVSKPLPKPAPKPAGAPTSAPNKVYTYEELKKKPLNTDHNNLEIYLSDEEFKQLFNCERSELSALPVWKRNNIKQKLGLF